MNRVRIAVTGVGLVTPLGASRVDSWKRLLAAERAGVWLPDSPEQHPAPRLFGAPVPGDFGGQARLISFASHAAREAVQQAKLTRAQLEQAAVVIGTSKVDLQQVDDLWRCPDATDTTELCHSFLPSTAASRVAAEFGCKAGSLAPVAACATGLVSLIRGANLIREGVTTTVLAGGADASLHRGLLASYRRLGVLARPEPDPASACRPFDRRRSGFIVGEGAGVLVLEEWNQAIERGCHPLAEWVDGLVGSDPSGLTGVDTSGEALAALLRRLILRTRVDLDSVDVVNLHGTATKLNDHAEAHALQRLFGPLQSRLDCFALKGAIGHLMGGAGAAESAACVLALADQLIPPTANHAEPDPDCGLRFTTATRRRPFDHVLKVSLGFGGHLAAGLFRRAR
ncbi:beta-ketoacyl-[acyl-carrier-protein] synthase family protein [Planctomicrobium sp. SH664]|uniref:beta-ketoacyl-[acyl-carrier-protein] synthase family protein n=1 Tax=Planctomicrobium sp. SH664 TaxID=3448125 RepID=UPI003F5C3F12